MNHHSFYKEWWFQFETMKMEEEKYRYIITQLLEK